MKIMKLNGMNLESVIDDDTEEEARSRQSGGNKGNIIIIKY